VRADERSDAMDVMAQARALVWFPSGHSALPWRLRLWLRARPRNRKDGPTRRNSRPELGLKRNP